MSSDGRKLIDVIVDAIKGYFAINGLILIGVYLIRSPEAAPFGYRFINYVSGFVAVTTGSVIGVWYTFHLAMTFHPGTAAGPWKRFQRGVWAAFVASAVLTILSVITGAITMSCGTLFN
ncbi:MAG: hypothetical protein ABIV50_09355 [Opitutus sp.]